MSGNRPTFVNQLMEMWNRLLWPQRLTIIISGVLGLALVGSIVYFMNRVEYEPVWSDLNPEDAQAVVQKLKEQKKAYRVQGNSILVAAPKTEIENLKLEIGGSVRSGRVGYEIFDKNQFGMTDFTEQVNLQRALEGELARTISNLAEISQARVHIVLPKDSIFDEKKEDAKASVVVSLRRGAELTKTGVAGIKGVVAGAVPGLHRNNVSIVDDEGRLLSQSVESGDGARAEMESSLREQYEKEMSGKVISILEPLVGKGKVHANASIDLDINSTEQMEETYNPNPQIIMSQQKSQERSGGSAVPSGVPGTQSNIGTANPPATASSAASNERQSETTNYEVNKLVRHVVQPKGTVRRLSVAVILDHKTVYSKSKDGKVTSKSEARTPQDIEAYRQLVLAAVGFNQQRGDVVTIENVPFYSDSMPEEQQPTSPWYIRFQSQPYGMLALKYGSFLLLFVLAYLFLFRPVHKKVFEAMSVAALRTGETAAPHLIGEAATLALPGERQLDELPAGSADAGSLPAAESNVEEMTALQAATDEQIEQELIREANMVESGGRKYAVIKKKLTEKAKKDPEMLSQLIRSLLKEKA